MIIGLLIRMLVNVNYFFFLAGTFVTSLGFCFMRSSANLFVHTWFPEKEIPIVNNMCLLSVFMSDSLVILLTSLFVGEGSSKDSIFEFFFVETIILLVIQMSMAIFFRGKPKNPPKYSV